MATKGVILWQFYFIWIVMHKKAGEIETTKSRTSENTTLAVHD